MGQSTSVEVRDECSEKNGGSYKIIMLGDTYVGKTCLFYKMSTGVFPAGYKQTVQPDVYIKDVEVDNQTIKINLWDTAGHENYRNSMPRNYYRKAHGVVFVYDVTKKSSLQNITDWMERYDDHENKYTVKVLVGNKCDLVTEREVPKTKAEAFAEKHKMLFFETSAKTDEKIDDIFMSLVYRIKSEIHRMHFAETDDETFQLEESGNEQGKRSCKMQLVDFAVDSWEKTKKFFNLTPAISN